MRQKQKISFSSPIDQMSEQFHLTILHAQAAKAKNLSTRWVPFFSIGLRQSILFEFVEMIHRLTAKAMKEKKCCFAH